MSAPVADTLPSVTIVRRIKATPARLFQAWTRPEQIARWWGPDAGPVLIAETDLRLGGRFRVQFRMLDGLVRDASGEYLEIAPDRRLVMSWAWAHEPHEVSRLIVDLIPIPEGTELTLTHAQLPNQAECDSHRAGWLGSLTKLETLITEAA